MATMIVRGTLFKVPDPENRQKLVEACCVLERDQAKVRLAVDPNVDGATELTTWFPSRTENPIFSSSSCLPPWTRPRTDGGNRIQPVPVLDDPRSNGHTVMVPTIFANAEDMKYYDTECPAHVALRKTAAKLVTERPLVVNMESREPRAVAAGWG